jgi:putative oxidoreductase
MSTLWKFIKAVVTSEYLALLLRVFLGLMFIYASMTKIPYPAEFGKNVEAYRLFPYWSVGVIAVSIPWLEMICGLFLIIGLATRAAAALIAALFAVFTIMLTVNVLRGSPITCGCFDSVGAQIGWWDVVRDVLLLLLALQVFFFDRVFIFRRAGLLGKKR